MLGVLHYVFVVFCFTSFSSYHSVVLLGFIVMYSAVIDIYSPFPIVFSHSCFLFPDMCCPIYFVNASYLPHAWFWHVHALAGMVGLSIGEKHFVQGGIAQDLRSDGRKRLTYRPISVETGNIPQVKHSFALVLPILSWLASSRILVGFFSFSMHYFSLLWLPCRQMVRQE